jgi:hypothetical protein
MKQQTGGTPEIPDWLASNLPAGAAVGIDAFVHTMAGARDLEKKLAAKSVKLSCVDGNLVDKCGTACMPAHFSVWCCTRDDAHATQATCPLCAWDARLGTLIALSLQAC